MIKRIRDGHITPAIAWSVFGTVVSGLSGPLAALLVTRELTPEEQGFYYTFNSVLGIAIFVELGLNACIIQFISHEFAHLRIKNGSVEDTNAHHYGRFISFSKFSIKWYLGAAILLFFALATIGSLFFHSSAGNTDVKWLTPWLLLCLFSCFSLTIVPAMGILEGCNLVGWTARARIIQNTIRSATLIAALHYKCGLYAPSIAAGAGLFAAISQVGYSWRGLYRQIIAANCVNSVNWRTEILPFQWRIAVSWASGYFISTVFGPILFSFKGAEVAGKYGLSWAILSAINGVAGPFVATRAPQFGSLLAKQEYIQLGKLWKIATFQAVFVSFIGAVFVCVTLRFIEYEKLEFSSRVLSLSCVIPLAVAIMINQYVTAVATLARAEKKEPFLVPSMIVAAVSTGGALLFVEKFSAHAVAYSYLAGAVIGLVAAKIILKNTQMIIGIRKG